jgi:uncharacterized protein YdhG (YjbR/CyaY superfamily)
MPASNKNAAGFSDLEKEAMKNRARELAAEAKSANNKAQGEKDVQQAIAKMPEPDRSLARKLHALILEKAPSLSPKTWYGMPSYANKDGKVVCFFQNASKFKYRYSTLGFMDTASLDDGSMWPTTYAIMKLTPTEEAKIAALLKKAVK